MPTLAPGSTPFPLIRDSIVNRVAAAIGSFIPVDGPPPWVRPVSSDDYQITANENWFAYIRSYGPSPIDSRNGGDLSEQGAGRLTVNVARRIRIYLYNRAGMDVTGGDEVTLGGTDPTQTINTPPTWPGHDIAEDLLLNALLNFLPTYTDPDDVIIPLTLGPLHWVDSSDGPAERKPDNNAGLVRSHLDFQVVYLLSINQGDPAPLSLPVPINNPV